MTKKEFKRAMLCGLGRCILELRETKDKEKYRDIVLWASSRNISYDVQCEGTRAWYVYEMICCYEDKTPFLDTIIERFLKTRSDNNWDFSHYCALLGYFSDDGDERAYRILWKKYQELLTILLYRRKKDQRVISMYEALAIMLSGEDYESAFRVVNGIGKMLQKVDVYKWEDFLWANHCIQGIFEKSEFLRELKKIEKYSLDIRCYLEGMEEYNKKEAEQAVVREKKDIEVKKKEALQLLTQENPRWRWAIMRLRNCLLEEGIEYQTEIANQVLSETDEWRKSRLLFVFADAQCPWPLDLSYLIPYVKSPDKKLREAALDVLCYIKDEKVREFALQNIEQPEFRPYAVKMLATNYQKKDRDILMQALRKIPVDSHSAIDDWHGVYSMVFDLFDNRQVKNPPKEILYYLYENTMCGWCRESYVREMKRRHILTDEIRRECKWDSNDEIRELVS